MALTSNEIFTNYNALLPRYNGTYVDPCNAPPDCFSLCYFILNVDAGNLFQNGFSGFSENWLEIDIDRAQELTDKSDPASGIRTISVTAVGDRWSDLSLSEPLA